MCSLDGEWKVRSCSEIPTYLPTYLPTSVTPGHRRRPTMNHCFDFPLDYTVQNVDENISTPPRIGLVSSHLLQHCFPSCKVSLTAGFCVETPTRVKHHSSERKRSQGTWGTAAARPMSFGVLRRYISHDAWLNQLYHSPINPRSPRYQSILRQSMVQAQPPDQHSEASTCMNLGTLFASASNAFDVGLLLVCFSHKQSGLSLAQVAQV